MRLSGKSIFPFGSIETDVWIPTDADRASTPAKECYCHEANLKQYACSEIATGAVDTATAWDVVSYRSTVNAYSFDMFWPVSGLLELFIVHLACSTTNALGPWGQREWQMHLPGGYLHWWWRSTVQRFLWCPPLSQEAPGCGSGMGTVSTMDGLSIWFQVFKTCTIHEAEYFFAISKFHKWH